MIIFFQRLLDGGGFEEGRDKGCRGSGKTEVGGRRGGGGRSMGVINTTSTPSSHGKMGQEDGIFREGIRTIYPFD